ncbi:MAG: AAA family ATPase [Kiritimatiellae bacterium]|nr:AAA family ATPase [Kiritimatiellia bacterium]
MKICVYGLPQSGKDTFIRKLTSLGFEHLPGSRTLKTLALQEYQSEFSNLSENQKTLLRQKFITILQSMDGEKRIVVDGHYCFGNHIVFFPEEGIAYDVFIYLNTPPSVIHERLQKSERNIQYASFSERQLEEWQRLEIRQLSKICFDNRREFIVLDSSTEDSLLFLEHFFLKYPSLSSLVKAQEIADNIKKNCGNNKKIAIFDCDKTVSSHDITVSVFEVANISVKFLKQLFYNEPYTQFQFWKLHRLYDNLDQYEKVLKDAVVQVDFNDFILAKMDELRNNGYKIFGLTSGITDAWKIINSRYRLFSDVYGGILSSAIKGYVVQILMESGFSVFACGDSTVDIFMLESASIGVIWAPGKIRETIQAYFNENPRTTIVQFRDNPNQYLGIKSIERSEYVVPS